MSFDLADPTYRQLRSKVLQGGGRVVPFVGAGLSIYGRPDERLPLWRELIERLVIEGQRVGLIADEGDPALTAALDSGRYIEAMDRLLGALGEPTFRRVVERELDDAEKPTPPSIAELVTIGWSLIVTTNLDRFIARAYLERHGRPITAFTSLDAHRLAAALAGTITGADTLLAHIHGSVDDYPSWRLTRSHYEQLLQEPGYLEALKQLFLRQVFFVGFGLQDEDLDLMLETVARIYPAGVGEFYALIPSNRRHDDVIRHLVRTNGLQPIFYDVDPDPASDDIFGGHRAVFECLQDLARAWSASSRKVDVTLKYLPEIDPFLVNRDVEARRLADLILDPGTGVVQVVGLGGAGKTSLVQQTLIDLGPDLTDAGFGLVFGGSFARADLGQLIADMALATVGPSALPLPAQVERIGEHVRAVRTVMVLDGAEVLTDVEHQIRSPYLQQIIEAVVAGKGTVVTTSRVAVRGAGFDHAPVVEVGPLSPEQTSMFLEAWGLRGMGESAARRLALITAGHPLALRVLAGVLATVPVSEAISTLERSSIVDVADEVDPLSENRLSRVLGSYVPHLMPVEVDFLTAATVFDEPTSYAFIEATLGSAQPAAPITASLAAVDLRTVVGSLIERRLLTVSGTGELSSHPTVREYFTRRGRRQGVELSPLHSTLARMYMRDAPALAQSFDEARPLLAVCRHAAACGDWTLFDDTFRRRLMHDHVGYLCDYLGAWEEALTVSRLACQSSFPADTRDPAYYPLVAARSLKHLGRSTEARAAYVSGLRQAASTRDPECALYVNNFLTLLVWRGELAAADLLADMNVRALSWIEEEWRHRWQVEHGFSSIAYLRLLQGQIDTAQRMFDHSEHAWEGAPVRHQVWDYYPYYRSEVILMLDADDHESALSCIDGLLRTAEERGWPEPACRGHIQAATVHLDSATRNHDVAEIARGLKRLDQAAEITIGMNVPDVAIAHDMAMLRVDLVRRRLGTPHHMDIGAVRALVGRVANRIAASGLALASPDLRAAEGVVHLLEGDAAAARLGWRRAIVESRRQGNALTPVSPRSLTRWLGDQIGEQVDAAPTGSSHDLVDLVGSSLAEGTLLEYLDRLDEDITPPSASQSRPDR